MPSELHALWKVWSVAFICVTWRIPMWGIAHSHVGWPMSLCSVTHTHKWDVTNKYVCRDSYRGGPVMVSCATWRIAMWDVTHSYVGHDSWICVPWLNAYTSGPVMFVMTHSYAGRDSFIRVTWPMDTTHWCVFVGILVQPIAFAVSFLHTQISSDNLVRLFYLVPLKRNQGVWDWRLRLHDTPNAIGRTSTVGQSCVAWFILCRDMTHLYRPRMEILHCGRTHV